MFSFFHIVILISETPELLLGRKLKLINMNNLKEHWNTVYSITNTNKHTWTQDVPKTTLSILDSLNLSKEAKIIDVGGGDSSLVDNLISLGYKNITVLDISEEAINITKKRLGDNAQLIKWVITDITEYKTNEKYDVWIDRATFHFLKDEKSISAYLNIVNTCITENGYLLIASFSDKGPTKCSGLDIKQYSKEALTSLFESTFNREKCMFEDHTTPAQKNQNFIYVLLKRRNIGLMPVHNNSDNEYVKYQNSNPLNAEGSCDVNSKSCCC